MFIKNIFLGSALGGLLLGGVACQNMPGDRRSQGAVIGGVGGAVVGAAVGGEKHRLLGAILGGALGAGGGYVIGAKTEKIKDRDTHGAEQAGKAASKNPATAEDAISATTADLNQDGFVTLDEVVAMKKAGFSDDKIIDRLEDTGQIFELTEENRRFLRDQGVSWTVIDGMEELNREKKEELISGSDDVISRDRE